MREIYTATARGHSSVSGFLALFLGVVLLLFASSTDTTAQTVPCSYGYSYVYVTAPTAGSTYTRGDVMTIRWYPGYVGYWYSSYPPTFAIHYSTDGGATWKIVKEGINYNDRSYNWGIPITSQFSNQWMIRVVEMPNQSWSYCAYNYAGTVGTFTVLKGCFPPTFSQQPLSQTICAGGSASFSVATDGENPTYKWRKDGNVIATTPTLSLSNVQVSQDGFYDVVVTDGCGAERASGLAKLTVNVPPTITRQPPATVYICENDRGTFSVGAVGAGKTYQWRKNGTPVPGATDSTFVIDNAVTASEGNYDCVITGSCPPSVTSGIAVLKVPTRPRITAQPSELVICTGQNGQLSATATGNNLNYQWLKDGKPVPNGINPTLTFTNYDYTMDGQYQLIITSNIPNPTGCNLQAQTRTINVVGFKPPKVVADPVGGDACVGGSTTLVVQAEGTDVTYQWYKGGTPIPNSNTFALAINNAKRTDAGDYSVRVSSTCGLSVTSAVASIAVIEQPKLTKNPTDQSLRVGDMLTLTVEASDWRSVQWMKNGTAIPGATSPTYTVEKAAVSDNGIYSAIIRNGCGGVTSGYARVSVKDPSLDRPELTLMQNTADFGEIPFGYSSDATLTGVIKNTGLAPMNVTDVAVTSGFTIVSGGAPFTLAPNETSTVVLKATPTAVGPLTGTMTVTTNAPVPTGTVALGALSVVRYSHAAGLDFESVFINKDKELCVTLTNTSAVAIKIDAATITGGNAGDYTVVSMIPMDIAASASQDVCIKFAPSATGARSASIDFASSTGGNSSLVLSGDGQVDVSVNESAEVAGISVYPNPTHDGIVIRFANSSAAGTISIVNTAGMLVATVPMTDGAQEVRWNGRDAAGSLVPSGMYAVVIRNGASTINVPLSVVR